MNWASEHEDDSRANAVSKAVLHEEMVAILLASLSHQGASVVNRLVLACVIVAISVACLADEAPHAKQANDVLAKVITDSLAQRPTVVCWLVDASESMVPQRKAVAARLEQILNQPNNRDLQSVVVAFGQSVTVVTLSPTRDPKVVINAIERIPVDASGVEATFSAIKAAVGLAKDAQPKRNTLVVEFTDEVGDDQSRAEATSSECRQAGAPVYVFGVPAPFRSSEQRITIFPRYEQDVAVGIVSRGPESLFPEAVQFANDTLVDSGFGPYALSMICANTGGKYFRANSADGNIPDDENAQGVFGLNKFFSSETMAPYRPTYASREASEREHAANRAKRALVEAAKAAIAIPIASLQTVLPSEEDGVRKEVLEEAQKAAAKFEPQIDGIYRILVAGLPDREQIKEKRWQAGYDLALGRVGATKARVDTYNNMLALAKSGMKFKDKNSNTWELAPSEKISAGSEIEEMARHAKALLEKVVAEHPGTPWAYFASEELKTPFGYEWKERHTDERPRTKPSRPKRPLRKI